MNSSTTQNPLPKKSQLSRLQKHSMVDTMNFYDDDYLTCSTLHCSEIGVEKTRFDIAPWESLCDLSETSSTSSSSSNFEVELWETLCDFSETNSTSSFDGTEGSNDDISYDETCFQNDDDLSYYSTGSASQTSSMSFSLDNTSCCDVQVNITSLDAQLILFDASPIKNQSTQETDGGCSDGEVNPSCAPLLSIMDFPSCQPILTSTPNSIDADKDGSLCNRSTDSTYIFSSFDDENDENDELSVLSEPTEAMFSSFLKQRRKYPHITLSKSLKFKLCFCVVSIIYMYLCFVSWSNSRQGCDDDDESVSQEKVYINEQLPASLHNEQMNDPVKKFSLVDLQCVLFWFLLLTKGQELLSKVTSPPKKNRRTWKSHQIPLN